MPCNESRIYSGRLACALSSLLICSFNFYLLILSCVPFCHYVWIVCTGRSGCRPGERIEIGARIPRTADFGVCLPRLSRNKADQIEWLKRRRWTRRQTKCTNVRKRSNEGRDERTSPNRRRTEQSKDHKRGNFFVFGIETCSGFDFKGPTAPESR